MKKIKQKITGSIFAVILSLGSAHAGTELIAATWLPPQLHIPKYLFTYWSERVDYYSNKEISINLQLGSPITTPQGGVREIGDGMVDISNHFAAYTPSDLPYSAAIEELGMTYQDPRVIIAASTEFNIRDPRMQAEWANHGVVFGSSWASTPFTLVCNKEITTPDDFKGANMRMPSHSAAEWAESLGAITVPLNANEQYSALDTGILTCTTTLLGDAFSRKMYEVAQHVTELPITVMWAGLGHGYNANKWKGLTIKERKALLYAEADAMAALVVKGMIYADKDAKLKMQKLGVSFHEPSNELVHSIEEFRKIRMDEAVEFSTKNLGVKESDLLLKDFQSTVTKWEGILNEIPVDDIDSFAEAMRKEIYDKIDLSNYGLF